MKKIILSAIIVLILLIGYYLLIYAPQQAATARYNSYTEKTKCNTLGAQYFKQVQKENSLENYVLSVTPNRPEFGYSATLNTCLISYERDLNTGFTDYVVDDVLTGMQVADFDEDTINDMGNDLKPNPKYKSQDWGYVSYCKTESNDPDFNCAQRYQYISGWQRGVDCLMGECLFNESY